MTQDPKNTSPLPPAEEPMPPAPDSAPSPDPAWLPERLERARRVALQSFLADLGFADAAALEAALAERATLQASIAEAQAQAENAQQAQQALAFQAAFQRASRDYDFHDAAAAQQLADFSGLSISEGGEVQGMEAALEALISAHPYLLRRPPAPDIDAQAASNASEAEGLPSAESLPPALVERVRQKFRL